jgi:hypothetical protein
VCRHVVTVTISMVVEGNPDDAAEAVHRIGLDYARDYDHSPIGDIDIEYFDGDCED